MIYYLTHTDQFGKLRYYKISLRFDSSNGNSEYYTLSNKKRLIVENKIVSIILDTDTALLFDFNLQEKDTFRIDSYYISNNLTSLDLVVDSIDFIEIAGRSLTRQFVHNIGSNNSHIFVEGIGSTNTGLYYPNEYEIEYSTLIGICFPNYALEAITLDSIDFYNCNLWAKNVSVLPLDYHHLKLWPNPTTDKAVYIECLSSSDLMLFDHTGNLVYHTFISGETFEMSVNDFVPGVYYISLKHENLQFHMKLIIM